MTWHVWTDGSCQHGLPNVPKGLGGWGGWAAIVEHGSDGVVLRGRVPDTTNVRMELRAAVEGLRAVPADAAAVLHTDCSTVLAVYWAWRDGEVGRGHRGPDGRFWLELDGELARVARCHVLLLGKGPRDPVHKRAHVIAGAEARGGLRGLEPNAVPLEDAYRLRKHLQKTAARSSSGRPFIHVRGCEPGRCVSSCPVWLEQGSAVYESRRRSEARRL